MAEPQSLSSSRSTLTLITLTLTQPPELWEAYITSLPTQGSLYQIDDLAEERKGAKITELNTKLLSLDQQVLYESPSGWELLDNTDNFVFNAVDISHDYQAWELPMFDDTDLSASFTALGTETVEISFVEPLPTAQAGSETTSENEAILLTLTATDHDDIPEDLVFFLTRLPGRGRVYLNDGGELGMEITSDDIPHMLADSSPAAGDEGVLGGQAEAQLWFVPSSWDVYAYWKLADPIPVAVVRELTFAVSDPLAALELPSTDPDMELGVWALLDATLAIEIALNNTADVVFPTPEAYESVVQTYEDYRVRLAFNTTGGNITLTSLPASGLIYHGISATSLRLGTLLENGDLPVDVSPQLGVIYVPPSGVSDESAELASVDFHVTGFTNADGTTDTSSDNTLAIWVLNLNDPPTVPALDAQTLFANDYATLTLSPSDEDTDDSSLTVYIEILPTLGWLFQVNEDGTRGELITTTVTALTHSEFKVIIQTPEGVTGGSVDSFTWYAHDGEVRSITSCLSDLSLLAEFPYTVSDVTVTQYEDTAGEFELILSVLDLENYFGVITSLPESGTLYELEEGESALRDNLIVSSVPHDLAGVWLAYVPPMDMYDDTFVFASFEYQASNGLSTSTNTATVSINVLGVNDAPHVDDQTVFSYTGDAINITLTGSDPEDDDTLAYVVSLPSSGSLAQSDGTVINSADESNPVEVTGDDKRLVYTPVADTLASYSFEFYFSDLELMSPTAKISITVGGANLYPVAENSTITCSEDLPQIITLQAYDPDSEYVYAFILSLPHNGTLYQKETGSELGIEISTGSQLVSDSSLRVYYVPRANESGLDFDWFTFYVEDNIGATSQVGTVWLDVDAVNDPPLCDPVNETVLEDEVVVISLNATDIDSAYSTFTFYITTLPSLGSLYQVVDLTDPDEPVRIEIYIYVILRIPFPYNIMFIQLTLPLNLYLTTYSLSGTQ